MNIQNSNPETIFKIQTQRQILNLRSSCEQTIYWALHHLFMTIYAWQSNISIMYFNIKISVPYIYLCQWPLSIGFLKIFYYRLLGDVPRRRCWRGPGRIGCTPYRPPCWLYDVTVVSAGLSHNVPFYKIAKQQGKTENTTSLTLYSVK